jgi:hypothetical protein
MSMFFRKLMYSMFSLFSSSKTSRKCFTDSPDTPASAAMEAGSEPAHFSTYRNCEGLLEEFSPGAALRSRSQVTVAAKGKHP